MCLTFYCQRGWRWLLLTYFWALCPKERLLKVSQAIIQQHPIWGSKSGMIRQLICGFRLSHGPISLTKKKKKKKNYRSQQKLLINEPVHLKFTPPSVKYFSKIFYRGVWILEWPNEISLIIEYRSDDVTKNFFLDFSVLDTMYRGAWWKTSTAQIGWESVHDGPRYGRMNT